MLRATEPPPSPRFLVLMAGLGLLWRGLISALTPIPSEDGVSYLWMAERFAAGDPCAALGEVFPPLLAMLTAPLIALGLDPFRAAQAVLALSGAAAVAPLARAAEAVASGSGRAAAWCAVLAPLPVRLGAEVYTEPLFVLITALAITAGLCGRMAAFGLLAGLGFWVRPEAGALALGFGVVQRLRARAALPGFVALIGALALWRGICGHGYGLLPKLEFNWERSVASAETFAGGVARWSENLLELTWLWFEAFGLIGLLACLGLLAAWRRVPRELLWTLLFAVAVIAAFLPRRRFLVSWLPVVLSIAMLGLQQLPGRVRPWVLVLVVGSSAVLSLRTMDPDRIAERQLGRFLAPAQVVTGMTRVRYFAGHQPLPPRPFTAAELIAWARQPHSRVVVLVADRAHTPAVLAALQASYEPMALPAELARAVAARGMLVLVRR